MAKDLIVQNVRVSAPRLADRPNPQTGQADQVLDLEIAVRNKSSSTTYKLIKSLRGLDYDPITRTLLIGLSDDPESESERLHVILPALQSVEPNSSTLVHITVPLIFRRPKLPIRNPIEFESFDLSNAKQVKCTIGFGAEREIENQSDTQDPKINELRILNDNIEKTLKITTTNNPDIPMPEEGTSSPRQKRKKRS